MKAPTICALMSVAMDIAMTAMPGTNSLLPAATRPRVTAGFRWPPDL